MANIENDETKEKLQKIIDYYANPLDDRTIKEFCSNEMISEPTFYRYRKEFREQIFAQAEARRKIYQSELRSFGYKALVGRARKSDNAAKLLFQLLGDLIERTENVTSYETIEQKRDRIATLLKNAGLNVSIDTPMTPKQDAPTTKQSSI